MDIEELEDPENEDALQAAIEAGDVYLNKWGEVVSIPPDGGSW